MDYKTKFIGKFLVKIRNNNLQALAADNLMAIYELKFDKVKNLPKESVDTVYFFLNRYKSKLKVKTFSLDNFTPIMLNGFFYIYAIYQNLQKDKLWLFSTIKSFISQRYDVDDENIQRFVFSHSDISKGLDNQKHPKSYNLVHNGGPKEAATYATAEFYGVSKQTIINKIFKKPAIPNDRPLKKEALEAIFRDIISIQKMKIIAEDYNQNPNSDQQSRSERVLKKINDDFSFIENLISPNESHKFLDGRKQVNKMYGIDNLEKLWISSKKTNRNE